MGLYKEIDYELLQLHKQQRQVYNDACDIGILVEGPDDPVWLKVKELLSEPFYIGGIKKHRDERKSSSSTEITVTIHLPWEQEGGKNRCTKWEISYFNDKVRKVRFISLNPSNTWATDDVVWEEE